MMAIYTLGYTVAYRATLDRGPIMKLGPTATYPGGSVWQTPGEVFSHIAENQPRLQGYAVFAVDADWDTMTGPSPGNPWHDLLVDAPILNEVHNAGQHYADPIAHKE